MIVPEITRGHPLLYCVRVAAPNPVMLTQSPPKSFEALIDPFYTHKAVKMNPSMFALKLRVASTPKRIFDSLHPILIDSNLINDGVDVKDKQYDISTALADVLRYFTEKQNPGGIPYRLPNPSHGIHSRIHWVLGSQRKSPVIEEKQRNIGKFDQTHISIGVASNQVKPGFQCLADNLNTKWINLLAVIPTNFPSKSSSSVLRLGLLSDRIQTFIDKILNSQK